MSVKNSVKFIGGSELLFTDEKGKSFLVNIQILPIGEYDMVLFTREIQPLVGNRELTDNDREIIISKILELTKDIKWQIQ
jgi:hypothetical protein